MQSNAKTMLSRTDPLGIHSFPSRAEILASVRVIIFRSPLSMAATLSFALATPQGLSLGGAGSGIGGQLTFCRVASKVSTLSRLRGPARTLV